MSRTIKLILVSLLLIAVVISCQAKGSELKHSITNPDIYGFFNLANLNGLHYVELPDAAILLISPEGMAFCPAGYQDSSECNHSDLNDVTMVTALSGDGELSLAWSGKAVLLRYENKKVNAYYCEGSCDREDFKPISFK